MPPHPGHATPPPPAPAGERRSAEPYFRFPLAALRLGEEPLDALYTISGYGIVSAGVGLRRKSVSQFDGLLAISPAPPARALDAGQSDLIAVGANLTGARVDDGDGIWREFERVSRLAGGEGGALVTMRARWVWNAIHSARMAESGQNDVPGFDPTREWLSWREFRLLCAILSVMGKKPFAWISSATLAHRACGHTRKPRRLAELSAGSADFSPHRIGGERGQECPQEDWSADFSPQGYEERTEVRAPVSPPHLPPLSRWQIERTLLALERNRFFLRFRASGSRQGRGGRTAYSFRHKTREALAAAVKQRTARGHSEQIKQQRECDRELWVEGGEKRAA